MSFLHYLFGKQKEKSNSTEPLHEIKSTNDKIDYYGVDGFTFYVNGLQDEFKEFSRVGESVKLWIPKEGGNPDKVRIYHRDGPRGCLGIVPSRYSNIIISHLKDSLDYESIIEEITDNMCKIKCRLYSKEETIKRKENDKESIRTELTKPYNPKKPITINFSIDWKKVVKGGEKLVIKFDDIDSYVQLLEKKHGNSQLELKFLNQNGDIIGIYDKDKTIIQRILKGHFNSFLFDVEVFDTPTESNVNWNGYPTKVVITPYKNNNKR
jgi:hypothetical protein